ncbi:MAG TPA: sulfocyanin-like copper-binding protein [Candidatus Limnocylindrales bacterium]|nr:sulfocyanin-like copper-binding protein [Candidatus Limnocylindrales bacterium]
MAVELKEWSVTPSSATASAGSVTFNVTNSGTTIHEFVVVKTDTKAADLTVVDNKIDESVLTPVDEIEDIEAGATPTLTVDLAAGHYVLLCNIETHYSQGMYADFDVS